MSIHYLKGPHPHSDHVCVFSKTLEEHLIHLQQELQLIKDAQLYVNLAKCTFCVHELKFLGHIIEQDGIKVDPAKNNYKTMACASKCT